jgi:chemotaxis protein CheD
VSMATDIRRPADPAGRPESAPSTGGRRFFDSVVDSWIVKVFPGEYYVTGKADEVLITVLGSCVSACIRDP